MKKKAEIKKIVMDIGGEEVNLDMDQAKKLYELLGDLFGSQVISTPSPYPIIIERERPYWTGPYITWTGGGSDFLASYSTADQALNVNVNTAR